METADEDHKAHLVPALEPSILSCDLQHGRDVLKLLRNEWKFKGLQFQDNWES